MQSASLFLAIALLGPFALGLSAADWPQYRGPNRDGVSTETGLLKSWPDAGPKLLWTYGETGRGYSGPAIVGDRLYISGGRDDTEYAIALDLTAQPPKEIWATQIGPLFTWKGNEWNIGPNATPTVDGDSLFALGGFGDLVCFESATGKERWRVNLPRDLDGEVNPIGGGLEKPTPLGWGYACAPLVDGDKLICVPGGKRGLVAALDKKTGKVLWQSKAVTDQAPYASPIAVEIGGVKQYVVAINSGIVGVASADGKLLWRYRREPAYDDVVVATPVVHDAHVFTTVGFGQGCDLIKLKSEGAEFQVEKVFSNKNVQNRDGGVVRVGDYLYGHSEKGGWFCQEFKTGKPAWSERERLGRGSVTFADGRLYCCGEQGEVVLLEATSKEWTEAGRFNLPKSSKQKRPSGGVWTHPVVANGRLYLRDQEYLFCFDVKP